jgi:hypothetical protein
MMLTVTDDARFDADARAAAEREAADQVERAHRQAQEHYEQVERMSQDPELPKEWIRQFNWSYAGLLGIGAVMVQPFLAADSLEVSATVSVVAFSVAIPLLAALLMVSWQESFRGRMTDSRTVTAARPIAQMAALVGVVAGFWHIHWLAGVGLLASTLVAIGVHSAGWSRLELSQEATPEDGVSAEEPASPEPNGPTPQQTGERDDAANGSGTTEGVIAGIDWVTENAEGPSVANMSLGGGADEALDAAVRKSIEAGITYGVAAGNESSDASKVSPAPSQPQSIALEATGLSRYGSGMIISSCA